MLVMDFLLGVGTANFVQVLIASTGSLAEVGHLRIATTVTGVLSVWFSALPTIGLSKAIMLPLQGRIGGVLRIAVGVGGLLAASAIVIAVLSIALPVSWAVVVFGASGAAGFQYVLPLSLSLCSAGAIAGAQVALKTLGSPSVLLISRILSSLSMIIGTVCGIAAGDIAGAVWGYTVGSAVGGIMYGIVTWCVVARAKRNVVHEAWSS
jgi:hypothetical protein